MSKCHIVGNHMPRLVLSHILTWTTQAYQRQKRERKPALHHRVSPRDCHYRSQDKIRSPPVYCSIKLIFMRKSVDLWLRMVLLPHPNGILQEYPILKFVSYERKYMYVHEVLVNYLFKLAQEKLWLGELTVPP